MRYKPVSDQLNNLNKVARYFIQTVLAIIINFQIMLGREVHAILGIYHQVKSNAY